MTPPACPITGEPAVRLVQWVSARLLVDLWRIECGVDVRPSFGGVTRFGLWQSPTGLYFFDPMREGDGGFYSGLYSMFEGSRPGFGSRALNLVMRRTGAARPERIREEFRMAARHVAPGASVLDVGCGRGLFRHLLPHASYTGLDKHFGDDPAQSWLRSESLSEHLGRHAGSYDVVTAFQVLEHVDDPVGLLGELARAAKPGGTVVVGVPHVPSAHTRIPNYLINAVPHHLTWWTKAALLAAAGRVGLLDPRVEAAPWGELDAVIYWMSRCSPVKCRTVHYRHSWTWHAASLIGFAGGALMRMVRPRPRTDDEGASLVLVARVPEPARPSAP